MNQPSEPNGLQPIPGASDAPARRPCAPDVLDGMYGYPLAMAYVPKQYWGEIYEPTQALEHGTLFPELYLPILTANGTKGGAR